MLGFCVTLNPQLHLSVGVWCEKALSLSAAQLFVLTDVFSSLPSGTHFSGDVFKKGQKKKKSQWQCEKEKNNPAGFTVKEAI